MRIQACLHVDVETRRGAETLLGEPWFTAALDRHLGDLVLPGQPVEMTPPSSRAVGAKWYAVGRRGRLGVIPVSDGVDLVLQVEEGYAAGVRDRIFKRNRKRLQNFLDAVRNRWNSP